MSLELRLTTVDKARRSHEETNRIAREYIESDRAARDEKTARLRLAREQAAQPPAKTPTGKKRGK